MEAGAESGEGLGSKAWGLVADATPSIQPPGLQLGGVVMRFPGPPEESREAMKNMLEILTSGRKIESRDLADLPSGGNIMALVEKKIGAKVGAGAKLGFTPPAPAGLAANVFVGARAGAAAGIAQTWSVTKNGRLEAHAKERELSLQLSAAAGVAWRLTPPSDGVQTEAAEVSADITWSCRDKYGHDRL